MGAECVLVLLAGLPASGKSTFCRKIMEFAKMKDIPEVDFYHVEMDKFIKCNTVEGWKKGRIDAFEHVQEVISYKRPHDQHKRIIMIDDTLHYKSMRREYWKLAEKYQSGCIIVYLDLDLSTALKRNSIRNSGHDRVTVVTDETIIKIHGEFEAPSPLELNENRKILTILKVGDISTIDLKLNEIYWEIYKQFNHPLHDRVSIRKNVAQDDRIVTSQNKRHQIDIFLRKQFSEMNLSNEQRKEFAQIFTRMKSKFLLRLDVCEADAKKLLSDFMTIVSKSSGLPC